MYLWIIYILVYHFSTFYKWKLQYEVLLLIESDPEMHYNILMLAPVIQ